MFAKSACLVLTLNATFVFADPLPNTQPIEWDEEDLSDRLMDGAHRFVEATISAAAEPKSEANRERFRTMLGMVDERVSPARIEQFREVGEPEFLMSVKDHHVHQIRWPVLDGVFGEGLLLKPNSQIVSGVEIAFPEIGQTPEELIESPDFVCHSGFYYVIPARIDREIYLGSNGDDSRLKRAQISHREWIYRQAFHMGRHLLGYEIQTASAAADAFEDLPASVSGPEIALFTAAADTRFKHVRLRGYSGPLDPIWEAPLDRNLFGELPEFSATQVRSLIHPRKIIETTDGPEIEPLNLTDARSDFDPNDRHQRIFTDLERHIQRLVRASNDVRERFYLYQAEPLLEGGKWSTNKDHPTLDPAGFIENSKAFREKFHKEAMGAFDQQLQAPNPLSRQILETDHWTAWDVILDVYPDFFAWGVLILPKDVRADEKRPVVVCQHGRNGIPRDCIDANKPAYNDFAAKLAERGFITFVPHNLYRGEDRYRILDRKANAVGCSLFSFIIPSHRQILNWLKTQPNVDPNRIAFYGLSYGGETAVRVPPVLEDYAVVICSGDFNQWTRKVAATDFPNGFMKTIEWEMPYWNLGHTFDYAEMSYLIFPRPFMVERGHHDRVSRDHWVAHEYAKTRWLYAQFGLADRTEIEYFQGGHSINGKGTFEFLHKHLNWPAPAN